MFELIFAAIGAVGVVDVAVFKGKIGVTVSAYIGAQGLWARIKAKL